METFGGVACVTSEQHVDLRESDQKRDHADTATFLLRLPRANPTEGTQQKPSRRCVHQRGPNPTTSGDGVPDQEAEGGTKDK